MNRSGVSVALLSLIVVACASAPDGTAPDVTPTGVFAAAKPVAGGVDAIPADALLPDIVEEPPRHLNVQRAQGREILRFTSTHWNEGAGPLQIRGGGEVKPCTVDEGGHLVETQCTYATQELLNAKGEIVFKKLAGVALFHPDHGHWHQDNVADFILRAGSLTGPIVASAVKQTYCLIDYDKSYLVQQNSSRLYFDCNGTLQGISRGWGDEYHHATHGQSVDITNVPPGVYYLTHDADPGNKWIESRDDNNGSWAKFRLDRDSASGNGLVSWIEESPCVGIACGNTSNK